MRRPILLFTLTAVMIAGGCGEKLTPVNGVVTYDGTPVDAATVVFMNDSGSKTATAQTDDAGKFSLIYDNGPGIPPGSYKVMVTRTKITPGQAPGDPAKIDKDYLAKMKAKDLPKTGGGPAGFPAVKTGSGSKVDIGDLPGVYSSPSTTPLSVTVPATGVVELKLEKKK